MQSSPADRQWSYTDTDLSGIYSLRGLPQRETRQFAVNVDTAESDLAKVDPGQLPAELLVRDTWQGADEVRSAAVLPRSAWNRWLLWAALALLFVESLLAWQFGRGAA